MTSFSVILSQKTRIELEKLSQEVQERIKKKLKQTKDNPFHYTKKPRKLQTSVLEMNGLVFGIIKILFGAPTKPHHL